MKEIKSEEFNKRLRDKGINYERKTFKKDDITMCYWNSKNHRECTDHHIALEGLEFLAINGFFPEVIFFDTVPRRYCLMLKTRGSFDGETLPAAVFATLEGVG